jgi:hypothetical protein
MKENILPFPTESPDWLGGVAEVVARGTGDLVFSGKSAEVAQQFLFAVVSVSELLGGLGARAIDYEGMSAPSGGAPGDYAGVVTTLVSWKISLDELLHTVLDEASQRDRELWTLARGQFTRAHAPLTGAVWYTTASYDWLGRQYALDASTVWTAVNKIDKRLYEALTAREWVCKGAR